MDPSDRERFSDRERQAGESQLNKRAIDPIPTSYFLSLISHWLARSIRLVLQKPTVAFYENRRSML